MIAARNRYFGLRGRLVLLLALAVIPALIVLLINSLIARQAALDLARNDLFRLTSLAISQQTRAIETAHSLLTTLAVTAEVRGNAEPCSALLRRIHQENPTFTGFLVADERGQVRCGSPLPTTPLSVAGREWFSQAVQTGQFAVSDYRIGGLSGKPVLTAAYPLGSRESPQGVIFTGIDLTWLGQLAADPAVPSDATLVVLDRQGVTLAAAPLSSGIGTRDPLAAQTPQETVADSFTARDPAGTLRLYVSAPIMIGTQPIALVRVGVPETSLLAIANRAAVVQFGALLLLAITATLVVFYGGRVLIVRPMQRLLRATEALTAGDISARSQVPHSSDEIGRLALAFDTLAATLAQRELALRTSETRFRDLAENAQDVIYRFDISSGLEYISPSVIKLVGYQPEELASDPTLFTKLVDQQDWAQIQGEFRRTGMVPQQAYARWYHRDGGMIWTEQRLSEVRDLHGVLVGIDAIARDVTARRAAELGLRQRTELLQAIFDYTPFLIMVFDPEQRPVLVNAAWERRTGSALRDLAAGAPIPLVGSAAQPESLFELVCTADGQWHDLPAALRNGAELVTMSWAVVPLSDGGRIAFGQDIGERKRAEDLRIQIERRLQESQRLESLGVLAGGIAHDFNNLLVAIMGNAGLALEDLSANSSARLSITQIEIAARRAADLTRQMLAYAGKGRFDIQTIAVNALIEEMTHLLQASILKNVVIRYLLTEPLPAVEADATQIRQVVMNLVVNAAEAIGTRSGIITIATGRIWADAAYLQEMRFATELAEGEYVWVEVADTGHGMDAATRERIFDPFFSTKFTGRGLGLAAVQGIVRSHRGGIRVYSEVGRGTTFKILLPSIGGTPPQTASGSQLTWLGSGTVLLVDDEPEVRTIAARMLERLGFQVISAADGGIAIERFRELSEVRCVLLDLTMPHIGGEEAFRQIHQLRPEVPVIVMSGYHEQEIVSRFAGKGLAGALQKPFGPAELRAVLERALSDRLHADV